MDSNTKQEISDKYISENLIDYGDLNEKAENQIRDAIFYGLNQGRIWHIDNVFDSVIPEIERRRDLILIEPDGTVRETMINNLLIDINYG